jgi:ABC-type glucose/galactose transport system permease subunit
VNSQRCEINNAAVFHKFTGFLVTPERKSVQISGGHAERLERILSCVPGTVHFKKNLNTYIYVTLPCVYDNSVG